MIRPLLATLAVIAALCSLSAIAEAGCFDQELCSRIDTEYLFERRECGTRSVHDHAGSLFGDITSDADTVCYSQGGGLASDDVLLYNSSRRAGDWFSDNQRISIVYWFQIRDVRGTYLRIMDQSKVFFSVKYGQFCLPSRGGGAAVCSEYPVLIGPYIHLTVVASRSRTEVFFNGEALAGFDNTDWAGITGSSVLVVHSNGNQIHHYLAFLHEALTQSEVTDAYKRGFKMTPPAIISSNFSFDGLVPILAFQISWFWFDEAFQTPQFSPDKKRVNVSAPRGSPPTQVSLVTKPIDSIFTANFRTLQVGDRWIDGPMALALLPVQPDAEDLSVDEQTDDALVLAFQFQDSAFQRSFPILNGRRGSTLDASDVSWSITGSEPVRLTLPTTERYANASIVLRSVPSNIRFFDDDTRQDGSALFVKQGAEFEYSPRTRPPSYSERVAFELFDGAFYSAPADLCFDVTRTIRCNNSDVYMTEGGSEPFTLSCSDVSHGTSVRFTRYPDEGKLMVRRRLPNESFSDALDNETVPLDAVLLFRPPKFFSNLAQRGLEHQAKPITVGFDLVDGEGGGTILSDHVSIFVINKPDTMSLYHRNLLSHQRRAKNGVDFEFNGPGEYSVDIGFEDHDFRLFNYSIEIEGGGVTVRVQQGGRCRVTSSASGQPQNRITWTLTGECMETVLNPMTLIAGSDAQDASLMVCRINNACRSVSVRFRTESKGFNWFNVIYPAAFVALAMVIVVACCVQAKNNRLKTKTPAMINKMNEARRQRQQRQQRHEERSPKRRPDIFSISKKEIDEYIRQKKEFKQQRQDLQGQLGVPRIQQSFHVAVVPAGRVVDVSPLEGPPIVDVKPPDSDSEQEGGGGRRRQTCRQTRSESDERWPPSYV